MEKKQISIGDAVVYVDQRSVEHNALVTAVWSSYPQAPYGVTGYWGDCPFEGVDTPFPAPCINIVFVTEDESKKDDYGRQIHRETSVVHQDQQQAHGFYWREMK